MPTYQYACTECGHEFEAVQKFSDAALTECPSCTGKLRKVFSAVGVVFKGSGFYRTDSRAGAKAETKSDSPSTSSEKSAPASTSSDASSGSSSSTGSSSSKTGGESAA